MNVCHFSGRLTKDAEISATAGGMEIASFTLAVDCGFGDKKRTEFISCKRFKPGGMAPYLLKGRSFVITAEYQEDRWEKDGQKHSRPTWIVRDMEFGQGEKNGQQQAAPQQTPYEEQNRFPTEASGLDDAPF